MKKFFKFSRASVIVLIVCIVLAVTFYFFLFSPSAVVYSVNGDILSDQSAAVSAAAIKDKIKKAKDKKALPTNIKVDPKTKEKIVDKVLNNEKASILPNITVEKETKDTIRKITTGAAVGAGLGSIVPIVGTTVGGVIGAGTGFLTTFLLPFGDHLDEIKIPTEEIEDVLSNPAVLPSYGVSEIIINKSIDRVKDGINDSVQSVVDPVGYTTEKVDNTVEVFNDVWDTTEDLFNW